MGTAKYTLIVCIYYFTESHNLSNLYDTPCIYIHIYFRENTGKLSVCLNN